MIYSTGEVYDGEWRNDMKHGKGNLTLKDGSIILQEWHNNFLF